MGSRSTCATRTAVRAAAAGVDAVIHTAYRQVEDAWSINVEGSAAVAAAARGARLVHLSSDIVFDGTRGRYREDDPVAPVHAYGRSKAEAERLVAELHPEAAIVRTSLIYGGAEAGPQERLAREGRRFFVDEIRSPVQVEDLARALLELVPSSTTPARCTSAGADDISRYDLAVLLGADPARIERAHTTPGPGAERLARQLPGRRAPEDPPARRARGPRLTEVRNTAERHVRPRVSCPQPCPNGRSRRAKPARRSQRAARSPVDGL